MIYVEESKAGLVQDGLLIGGQPPTRLDRHEALFFQVGLDILVLIIHDADEDILLIWVSGPRLRF